MKSKVVIFLIFLMSVAVSIAHAAEKSIIVTSDRISAKTVWSGSVTVNKPITVAKGATLTIKPGTKVQFAKGAGITVEGALKAEGRKGSVIVFTSATKDHTPGVWTGIAFNTGDDRSMIKRCRIEYAGSLNFADCNVMVQDCELKDGGQGIVLGRKSEVLIKDNHISGMTNGGVLCQMGALSLITGNTIERAGPYGILAEQESQPIIKNNTVTSCDAGIIITLVVPPVENNRFIKNKVGILTSARGSDQVIRSNRLKDNETGIMCQQFSSPLIDRNEVTGSKEAIVCFRASSPWIRKNVIARNDVGISCVQLCNPKITLNDLSGNNKGIYLDLSSYAIINNNNIHDNKVQVELGNMSSDWEVKTNMKPARGAQAQNAAMAGKGKAVRQDVDDGSEIMGFVDATDNWWGKDVTAEMDKKGPEANIKSFIDYYDVPTRIYEGYSGIYVQDRIKYSGWKKAKIAGGK